MAPKTLSLILSSCLTLVQSHFSSLGCFRKPCKVACLRHLEVKELWTRVSCTSVIQAEESPLHKLRLLCPNCSYSWGKTTRPLLAAERTRMPSRAMAASVNPSLLLQAAEATARQASTMVAPKGRPQSPAHQPSPNSQNIDHCPFWKSPSTTFSNLVFLSMYVGRAFVYA